MSILGVNIYFWGDAEQVRFLTEALAPTAAELRREGLADRFWYKAFDARGPHLLALFHTDAARREALEERLARRLGDYLETRPSTVVLPTAELEERHGECRGKALCAVDREDGFEANNTLRFFDQPEDAFPFWLTVDASRRDELWDHMDRLSFWALSRLDQGRLVVDAVSLVAAVDRAVRRSGNFDTADLWRHHASTLLVPLKERLETEEDAVIADLPTVVGERNLQIFGQIFDHVEGGPELFPELQDLIDAALAEDGRPPERRRAVVREIVHSTLIQLQQPVRNHIPVILFAWLRRIRATELTEVNR